jgi:hypothetical protein
MYFPFFNVKPRQEEAFYLFIFLIKELENRLVLHIQIKKDTFIMTHKSFKEKFRFFCRSWKINQNLILLRNSKNFGIFIIKENKKSFILFFLFYYKISFNY